MVKGIKQVLKIKSPSRVMFEMGSYSGQGFALSLGDAHGDVVTQAKRLANGAVPNGQLQAWSDAAGWSMTREEMLEVLAGMSFDVPVVIDGREVARAQARANLSSSGVSRAGGFS